MPVWTQKEKLDGEMSRFLVEGGPAAVDRVVAHSMYDLAARRAVWKNLDDAGRVTHILPLPDISRANNRVVAFIGLDHVGDLIDGENEKNHEHNRGDAESHRAAQTSRSSRAR